MDNPIGYTTAAEIERLRAGKTAVVQGEATAGGVAVEREDYLSDAQARGLFDIEDDDDLPDGRVRVCQGEWVRIPGGYYFDRSAGLLHPETARPVKEPGEVERRAIVAEATLREMREAAHEVIEHLRNYNNVPGSRAVAMKLARETLAGVLTGDAQEAGR